MKRFSIIFIICLCVICLVGCQSRYTVEESTVNGMVISRTHISSYTDKDISAPQYHSPQYLVTVSYKDTTETFDSKDLYNIVECNTGIELILHSKYDSNGNLIKQSIRLPK